ncbi:hypothetical protein PC128_g23927 [Phytophthora cactorum]|nr:hypothetical protein PC122_g17429 [Phytophthora cactorum]KAG3146842.1 hypothetical protein PC128_g23927 [Phytophthora cactorum]
MRSAACVLGFLRDDKTAARDAILDNQPAPPDILDQPTDSDSPIFDTYSEQGGSEVIVMPTNLTVKEEDEERLRCIQHATFKWNESAFDKTAIFTAPLLPTSVRWRRSDELVVLGINERTVATVMLAWKWTPMFVRGCPT